jgi:formylmethanofuran dehydrogenase subunit E-like metal-binding protein
MHQAIVEQQQKDIGPVVGGANMVNNYDLYNSIIYKDQKLANFIKEQEVEVIQSYEDQLEQDRQTYLRCKKKTEDEEQLYQNLLEVMFPGYALTYYEQEKNYGMCKNLQFKDYVASVINQFSMENHDDTIDLSINSNERIDFFYQEIDSN